MCLFHELRFLKLFFDFKQMFWSIISIFVWQKYMANLSKQSLTNKYCWCLRLNFFTAWICLRLLINSIYSQNRLKIKCFGGFHLSQKRKFSPGLFFLYSLQGSDLDLLEGLHPISPFQKTQTHTHLWLVWRPSVSTFALKEFCELYKHYAQ